MGDEILPVGSFEYTPDIGEKLKEHLQSLGLPDTLYLFEHEEDTFVLKPLTRKEHLEIKQGLKPDAEGNIDFDAFYQKVCEYCVAWPDIVFDPILWDMSRAGYQSSIAREVLLRSGFPDFESGFTLTEVRPLDDWKEDDLPNDEVLASLKAEYPGRLSLVTVGSTHYVIRPVTRLEWKTIQSNCADLDDAKLTISERATVWSSKYGTDKIAFGNVEAGVVEALFNEISTLSCFNIRPTVQKI